MNNTTTYLIIGIIGVLVGMVFAVLLTRLKNPNKHDDVFNLTPEQREERDGDVGIVMPMTKEEWKNPTIKNYPATPGECYPEPVLVKVEKESSSTTADLYAQPTESYESKVNRIQKERTEQLQKEMEEKRMAQVEKDKLRDAEIEEERILKEEAARIKTELKKWMY